MLCQLACNAMHDTPIVEDDEITLLPSMCVDVLRGVDSALKAVADIADFVKVVDRCDSAGLGIFGP